MSRGLISVSFGINQGNRKAAGWNGVKPHLLTCVVVDDYGHQLSAGAGPELLHMPYPPGCWTSVQPGGWVPKVHVSREIESI